MLQPRKKTVVKEGGPRLHFESRTETAGADCLLRARRLRWLQRACCLRGALLKPKYGGGSTCREQAGKTTTVLRGRACEQGGERDSRIGAGQDDCITMSLEGHDPR